jgi:hypothetical protein
MPRVRKRERPVAGYSSQHRDNFPRLVRQRNKVVVRFILFLSSLSFMRAAGIHQTSSLTLSNSTQGVLIRTPGRTAVSARKRSASLVTACAGSASALASMVRASSKSVMAGCRPFTRGASACNLANRERANLREHVALKTMNRVVGVDRRPPGLVQAVPFSCQHFEGGRVVSRHVGPLEPFGHARVTSGSLGCPLPHHERHAHQRRLQPGRGLSIESVPHHQSRSDIASASHLPG